MKEEKITPDILEKRIRQGLGNEKADMVIRNTDIFYAPTGEILRGDIAICGDRIVGVGECYEGREIIDGTNLTAVPGFIDGHVHVESSLVTPFEFERCVLPHGTTTAICDPHELSNVEGSDAIRYFSESAERMVMDLFVNLSSGVPATHLETSGAELDSESLKKLKDLPRVLGLGEMMNVPGVLNCDRDILKKLLLIPGCVDGHSPLLSGRELNAYLAAGVSSCHESSKAAEAREKLRKGMFVLIREGSVAKNLDELLPLVNDRNSAFIAFCTDDRNPLDIAEEGHIDGIIARAIAKGADPVAVYRSASFSAARHYGLNDRGLIAPGYKADIVLLSDYHSCRVKSVLKNGQIVSEALFESRKPCPVPEAFLHSIRRAEVAPEDFAVHSSSSATRTIGVVEHSLITEDLTFDLELRNGVKLADPSRDVLKIAVLERHGKNGNTGRGFVHGFGLKNGALAASVGHDSHNICVVGVSDADMAMAVNALIHAGGGYAVVLNGKVDCAMPLPVGGILSDHPFEEVTEKLRAVRESVRKTGCVLREPLMQLVFLPLPVIPFLKITDRGMVDVQAFRLIQEE